MKYISPEQAERVLEDCKRIGAIHAEIVSCLVDHGYDESEAMKIFALIATGSIKNVTINY